MLETAFLLIASVNSMLNVSCTQGLVIATGLWAAVTPECSDADCRYVLEDIVKTSDTSWGFAGAVI